MDWSSPGSSAFPRQEYWNGLPYASPRDLPNLGIELSFPALAGGFFIIETPGNHCNLPNLITGLWGLIKKQRGRTLPLVKKKKKKKKPLLHLGFVHSLTNSLIHSLIHSFTHSFISHSLSSSGCQALCLWGSMINKTIFPSFSSSPPLKRKF